MSKFALLVVFLLALVLASPASALEASDGAPDAAAVEAYRQGDLQTARTLWLEALEAQAPRLRGEERARILYNLGNLALREGRELDAVGWYTASLRLRPRDGDTWANLEFARLEAGLEPADRGDLADTLERLLSSWTPGESRDLALLALLPLALALLFEALRGGRVTRIVAAAALLVALLGAAPWVHSLWTRVEDPVLVIASGGARARAEPREGAASVERVATGAKLERLATHPGWVQVELAGGERAWLRDSSVFALDR